MSFLHPQLNSLPPNQSSQKIYTGRLMFGWIKWVWAASLFYRSTWQYQYNKWMKQQEGKSLFNIILLPTNTEQNVWKKEQNKSDDLFPCAVTRYLISAIFFFIIIVVVLNTETKMHIEYFYHTEEWLQIGNTRVLNTLSSYTSFCIQIMY